MRKRLLIAETDRVVIKKLYKYPVPTAAEVKLMFDLLDDLDPLKICLALITVQGLRPAEAARTVWSCFNYNKDGTEVSDMRHLCYKPKNMINKTGATYVFKEVKKPIYCKWLSDLLIRYSKYAPKYVNNKLFPFNESNSINKFFTRHRKKFMANDLSSNYDFLCDQTTETIQGTSLAKYRLHPYALRRFAFTFHYYVTFREDMVSLSRAFGHSNPKTTSEHYVMPKEAIGLTDEMIKNKITIDKFIHLKGQNQLELNDFDTERSELRILSYGQTQLCDY